MEGEVNPQSGHQQRELELDIPLLQKETHLQTEDVQFETTFSELSYTEPSFSRHAFTDPTHIEIPHPQASPAPGHAPWMDLSTQINSFGTFMEELAMVSDTRFYSMEDCMDQYQASFTSQFEYLQQMIDRIRDRLELQHEKMMPYLHFMFPPPQP